MSKKYKAVKPISIGDELYAPGDFIDADSAPDVIGSWVFWGDVEVVVEPDPPKKTAAKKTAVKKTSLKKEH